MEAEMKKSLILKLVLTAVLVFTFTGCGSDQEVDSSSSDANIQEELSAETPDDGMSADKEDVSGTPDQDKEDTSSVASSGGRIRHRNRRFRCEAFGRLKQFRRYGKYREFRFGLRKYKF